MIFHARALILACFCFATACQTRPDPSLPRGAEAYGVLQSEETAQRETYRIGPFDRLTINVFNEPTLSFTDIPVDAEGKFEFPLIGSVKATGQTANELSTEIKQRLDSNYYRDANVTVFVNSSSSQFITIEGSVTEPGRYQLPNGRASLLEVVALAKSPTRTARLSEVVVFRQTDGQRYGAVFDLNQIRQGAAPDPELRSGDVVYVGFSAIRAGFRDFLLTAPFFNVFRPF